MRDFPWFLRPRTRRVLLGLAVLAALQSGPVAGDGPRRFGKTDTQILAMGREKWGDFHAGKAGHSTAAMNEGQAAWREVCRRRNDRLAAAARRDLRGRVTALRPLLVRFTDDMMAAGSYITGGGTIWSTIHSAALADSEEVLHAILGGKEPAAKPTTSGEVLRAWTQLQQAVKKADFPERGEARRGAERAVTRSRETFRLIVAQCKGLSRRSSDQVLAFCLRQIDASDDLAEPQ
jgi:hypothetical protein